MSILREVVTTLNDEDFANHPFECLWELGRMALGLLHDNTVAPWPELSPRERRILAIARREGCVSQSVLRPYFPDVTSETVRLALVNLCERGRLIKWGQNRGATYTVRVGRDVVRNASRGGRNG